MLKEILERRIRFYEEMIAPLLDDVRADGASVEKANRYAVFVTLKKELETCIELVAMEA